MGFSFILFGGHEDGFAVPLVVGMLELGQSLEVAAYLDLMHVVSYQSPGRPVDLDVGE